MENFCTTTFDIKLWRTEEHFNSHPQMLPYISAKWSDVKQKILILGESHFQPEGCAERMDKEWYSLIASKLYEDEIRNTYTRNIIYEKCFQQTAPRSHSFFQVLSNELSAVVNCNPGDSFQYVSFYNYFQRPAAYGQSLRPSVLDNQIAYRVLKSITATIAPQKIIFTSLNAAISFFYNKSKDADNAIFNNAVIDYTVHPCCSWWHRPLKRLGNRTGKQKFIDILNR